MRVTGGVLGGRVLRAPRGPVRPTQDRVREALFSMLGEAVRGARFLDLFAGSGAVGIEAWSRGAAEVWLVESDRRAYEALRANLLELCDGRARAVRADAAAFLKKDVAGGPFDIIFADPPYLRLHGREPKAGGRDWLPKLLDLLGAGCALRPGGRFVMEAAAEAAPALPPEWALDRDRRYGDSRLLLYRQAGATAGEEEPSESESGDLRGDV